MPRLYLAHGRPLGGHPKASGEPLALALADFDNDGIDDLAVGGAIAERGWIAVYRGNLNAFAPQTEESFSAIGRSDFPAPYLDNPELVPIPNHPDFLVAGDFVGHDGVGLAAATRGSTKLMVMGRGKTGKVQLLQSISVPGPISGMNARLKNVFVGLADQNAPGFAIFTGAETGATLTERFTLPAPATSFSFGNLDGDDVTDALIVAGGELFELHGTSRRIEKIPAGFEVRSAIVGTFASDRDSLQSITALATDGSVHVLAQGGIDARPFTTEELQAMRRANLTRGSAHVRPEERSIEWKEVESHTTAADPHTILLPARISSNGLDDVMLISAAQMTVLAHPDINPTSGVIIDRRDLATDAVAAIPARVNIDGRPGVVLLERNDTTPHVMMPLPDPTFFVNRTDDPAIGSTTASPCTNVSNTDTSQSCSLREAVIKANATAGTDTIMLAAGTYTLAQPRIANNFTGQHGTLEVTDSVNIVGAGPGVTIIQGGTTSSNGVDKVMSINQDIAAFTNATASLSNLTIQFGFNRGNTGIQDGWGGALDFDTGTNGTANLTITNCTLTNNTMTDGEGGGLAVFNTKNSTGIATLINSTIQNNSTFRSSANAAGNGGGIAVLFPASIVVRNSRVINNLATQVNGTGKGVGGGVFIIGGSPITTATFHSTTISGNASASQGGGIWTDNSLTMDTGSSVTSNSAGSDGGGIWHNPPTTQSGHLTKVTIAGNSAAGNGGGILTGNTSGAGSLTMSFSRIASNNAASGANLFNTNSTVNATDNWWGTNSPSATIVNAAGGITSFSPSIALTFTAAPTSVTVGTTPTSTMTASFLQDSAGTPIAASSLDVLSNVPVSFGNPVKGTLSNAQSAIQTVRGVGAASESGTTVTITTTVPHGFGAGQSVTIAGVGAGYDGEFAIATPTPTTLTYTASASGLSSLGAGGTASVPSGTATVTFTGTSVGAGHADAIIDGFTLTSGTIAVNATTTTAAAAATSTFNTATHNVTLTGAITSGAGTVAGGTVTFAVFDSSNTQVGTAVSGTVNSGSASAAFSVPAGTNAGPYSIHASYSGTSTGAGDFLSSSDATHVLTINAATTTTVSSNASVSFSAASQTVSLSGAVSSPGGDVNGGVVTFAVFNGPTQIGTAATSAVVSAGNASATFTVPGGTPAGTYTIQAAYGGTSNFASSTESTGALTVNKVTPTIGWSNPADIVFGSALSSVQLNATAGIPGAFAYTPPAGTVLPVGAAQMLSVLFTPTDTTNFNTASKTVAINVTSAGGLSTLVMTQSLARDSQTNEVVLTLSLSNTGSSPATGLQITAAKIGNTPTTTALPVSLPDVPAGGVVSGVVRFPASVGSSGARAVSSIQGTYNAGSFGGSGRIVIP